MDWTSENGDILMNMVPTLGTYLPKHINEAKMFIISQDFVDKII